MLKHRRFWVVTLMILGGLLMFLAPEEIWIGAVMFAGGIVLELVGIKLEHSE